MMGEGNVAKELNANGRPSAVITAARPVSIDDLTELYSVQDRAEVGEYLRQFPFLVPLLKEARGKIARYFGVEVQVSLAVVESQEDENDRELYAKIHTSAPSESALKSLRSLDAGWWLDALDQADGKLTITLRHT